MDFISVSASHQVPQLLCTPLFFHSWLLLMSIRDEKETLELGIIGAGGMGRFYAQRLSKAGWKK